MNLEITLSVPYEHVAGALASGCRTGIRYWGKLVGHSEQDLPDSAPTWLAPYCEPLFGGWLVIQERDSGNASRVDRESLQIGLQRMAELAPERFAHIMRGMYDAIDGDCLIQCCCFGELRYG